MKKDPFPGTHFSELGSPKAPIATAKGPEGGPARVLEQAEGSVLASQPVLLSKDGS